MFHLNPERLAELADVEPTAPEAAHLAACLECARERDAYRSLLTLAQNERLAIAPPMTDWKDLAAELREEGLIREKSDERTVTPLTPVTPVTPVTPLPVRRSWTAQPWLRVAAAVLLVAGGVMGGRMWGERDAERTVAAEQRQQTSNAEARLASNETDSISNLFTSVDDARAVLRTAEQNYRLAVLYLAEKDTSVVEIRGADAYRARLAALDAMAGAALKGVQVLPHDPVMNQYYLSANAAREATVKQLSNALLTSGLTVEKH